MNLHQLSGSSCSKDISSDARLEDALRVLEDTARIHSLCGDVSVSVRDEMLFDGLTQNRSSAGKLGRCQMSYS